MAIICMYIRAIISARGSIEVFYSKVKPKIGGHLYSFEFNLLNKAFSKARVFEAELQVRILRMQR